MRVATAHLEKELPAWSTLEGPTSAILSMADKPLSKRYGFGLHRR